MKRRDATVRSRVRPRARSVGVKLRLAGLGSLWRPAQYGRAGAPSRAWYRVRACGQRMDSRYLGNRPRCCLATGAVSKHLEGWRRNPVVLRSTGSALGSLGIRLPVSAPDGYPGVEARAPFSRPSSRRASSRSRRASAGRFSGAPSIDVDPDGSLHAPASGNGRRCRRCAVTARGSVDGPSRQSRTDRSGPLCVRDPCMSMGARPSGPIRSGVADWREDYFPRAGCSAGPRPAAG